MTTKQITWFELILLFGGLISLFIGAAGFLTWGLTILNNPGIINLLSLQEIADPIIFLIGITLFMLAIKRNRIAFIIAAFILLALILATVDFISLKAPTDVLTLTILLGLALATLSLFLLSYSPTATSSHVLLTIFSGFLIALGVYLFLAQNRFFIVLQGWEHFAFGNLSIALSFLILGFCYIAIVIGYTVSERFTHANSLPMGIVTVVFLATFMLWMIQTKHNTEAIYQLTAAQQTSVENEIEAQIQLRVDALKRMRARWEQRGGIPYEEWYADALSLVDDYPGYQALEWIDEHFQIQWVAPVEGNEAVRSLNSAFDERRESALAQASNNRGVTFSHAIELVQGGLGLLIYLPLYVENEFQGFLLAAVRFDLLFNTMLPDSIARNYHIAVYDEDKVIYGRGEGNTEFQQRWGVDSQLPLYGVTWRIDVWPSQSVLLLQRSVIPTLTLVIGILLALLLGLLMRLAQIAAKRAQLLSQANKQLQQEMELREIAERERRQMQRIVNQQQKLQAIGTLAGGIAHDFNNILYAIKGYVSMAHEDANLGSRTRKNLSKVLTVSERGEVLVKQILAFSRDQKYQLTPLSLHMVIEETINLITPSLPPDVEFIYHHYRGETPILGSMAQLQQVIINIVNNAVDAFTDAGTITLTVEKCKTDARFKQEHPELNQAAYFKMDVQDTGRGMDSATVARIFEPFFTTKPVDEGTGLGLATAHGIIQEHSGTIAVKSKLGVGTTFTIYLPEYRGE